jgi:hypothetical protein
MTCTKTVHSSFASWEGSGKGLGAFRTPPILEANATPPNINRRKGIGERDLGLGALE